MFPYIEFPRALGRSEAPVTRMWVSESVSQSVSRSVSQPASRSIYTCVRYLVSYSVSKVRNAPNLVRANYCQYLNH